MVLTQLTKPALNPFLAPPDNGGQSRRLHRADASIPSQQAQAAAGLDVVFE